MKNLPSKQKVTKEDEHDRLKILLIHVISWTNEVWIYDTFANNFGSPNSQNILRRIVNNLGSLNSHNEEELFVCVMTNISPCNTSK